MALMQKTKKQPPPHWVYHPFFMKDYLSAARKYDYNGVTQALLLLHHYNLKSVGVGNIGKNRCGLIKRISCENDELISLHQHFMCIFPVFFQLSLQSFNA